MQGCALAQVCVRNWEYFFVCGKPLQIFIRCGHLHSFSQAFQWSRNKKAMREPSSGLDGWVATSCVAEENAAEHPVVLLHTQDIGAMAHAAR